MWKKAAVKGAYIVGCKNTVAQHARKHDIRAKMDCADVIVRMNEPRGQLL